MPKAIWSESINWLYKFLVLQTLNAHVLLMRKQGHTTSTEKERLKTTKENNRQTHWSPCCISRKS
jgi:quinol-cytochrome oxidoreductase complex cytochrome b subunit